MSDEPSDVDGDDDDEEIQADEDEEDYEDIESLLDLEVEEPLSEEWVKRDELD